MSLALSFLGESGYFTIFSTHPKTKSRIKKVEKIKLKNKINLSFVSHLFNALSLLFIFYITIFFGIKSDMSILINYYTEFTSTVLILFKKIQMKI